ncbi:MAG: hypothetical protein F4Y50_12070 [Dehalococcoidia bacterium]|nr:hypothetical protein [Dehalococcoidia bacterium]
MRLYIGKNHQKDVTTPVQSIFRLAGSDEDALTFALGFLLAHDPIFCAELLRRTGVAPRRSVKLDYAVHLQEVTEPGFGRRDIVIQGDGIRVVVEAKIGGAEPSAAQLLKYGTESDLWKQFTTRVVVALTQVELSTAVREKVRCELSRQGIRFSNIQWHEVVSLALGHRPSDDSEVSRYLFDEFTRYIRRDYRMGYYDAEILIQDVNPLNAKIFEEGWMYVTSPKDKKAPLYFAPYFTRQSVNTGISMISRVMDAEIVVLADKQDVVDDPTSDEHLKQWRNGLNELRKRAEAEGFADTEVRLFYLDCPVEIARPPITKTSFNQAGPSKRIPNQIPKGFSLRFDDLLKPGLGIR